MSKKTLTILLTVLILALLVNVLLKRRSDKIQSAAAAEVAARANQPVEESPEANERTVEKQEPLTLTMSKPYRITVDYRLTFGEAWKAGKYSSDNQWLGEDFKDEFPSTQGIKALEIFLIDVNKDVDARTLRIELEERNLRPVGVRELLALGAQYPDLQTEKPIIAIKGSADEDSILNNPILSSSREKDERSFFDSAQDSAQTADDVRFAVMHVHQ